MKSGVHLPAEQRDDMARFAVGLAASLRPVEAKRAVAGLFKVSESTAPHLIARGRFLTTAPRSAGPTQGRAQHDV